MAQTHSDLLNYNFAVLLKDNEIEVILSDLNYKVSNFYLIDLGQFNRLKFRSESKAPNHFRGLGITKGRLNIIPLYGNSK